MELMLCEDRTRAFIEERSGLIGSVLSGSYPEGRWLGWLDVDKSASAAILAEISEAVAHVRKIADVMIVIGIGGSNRGAMAAIKALRPEGGMPTRILWAGDTLSGSRLQEALQTVKTCSTVLNVIAKDFSTVEPGIAFRVLRAAMEEKYGEGARERIVATGSEGAGQLGELSREQGWRFLPFPADIGGRFSVLSAVGLFPMSVAGIDIGNLTEGARAEMSQLGGTIAYANPAVRYAANRNILFREGFTIESLVVFEPDLVPFARWWIQLFAETEGKKQEAVFPTFFCYSEDLHAVGQYVQQGRRCIAETFLGLFRPTPGFAIRGSPNLMDGFDYLNGRPFDDLNGAVYAAALRSHRDGGVPCAEIAAAPGLSTALDERTMGALFYFFMYSAYLSAAMIGVDPFTQDGVEGYKRTMYRILGKAEQ